jgi:hypothetical protein
VVVVLAVMVLVQPLVTVELAVVVMELLAVLLVMEQ